MFDRIGTDAAPATHDRHAAGTPRCTRSTPKRASRGTAWPLAVAAALALVLVACGGGGDAGGVGSNGTGITMGTVNGFGSVIVDGLEFDDTNAKVTVESSDDSDTFLAAEVKLGQRTRVEYSGSVDDSAASRGVASRIEVDPSIVGVVTAKGVSTTTFVVLGQTVEVNATVGPVPVTVFEGYAGGFADVAAGDTVEVHAIRSGSGPTAVYQATRVEKKAAAAFLRLGGVVGNLGAGDKTFQIGGLTVRYGSATLLPKDSAITAGASVVVFAPVGALSGTELSAQKIRVRTSIPSSPSDDVYVSGLVSGYVAGSSMTVDGTTIDLSGSPEISGAVADKAYVRVKGVFVTGGGFKASKVQVRDGGDDALASELKGTVQGYVAATTSTAGSFSVRGTPVTVPAGFAGIEGCGTDNAGLVNGVFVEVKGVVSSTGLTASRIQCEEEGTVSGAVVTRTGTIGNFSASANTFDLQVDFGTTVKVQYGSTTVFVDSGDVMTAEQAEALLASSQSGGLGIEVEGLLVNGTLTAQKIKPDSGDD